MTNADYYVNVYRDGVLGVPHPTRALCNYRDDEYCPIPVIGVWHVRLKSNAPAGGIKAAIAER